MAIARRDAAATRQRLFDTARALFAEKGFDAARVDDVAARAGVNKRMIYAYFGSKEALYHAVMRDAYLRLLESERAAVARVEGSPLAKVEALVRGYFAFLGANPDFVRLVGHDLLDTREDAGSALETLAATGLGRLEAIVMDGVAAGQFRPDLDVRRMVTSVAALCLGFFQRAAILRRLWGMDLDDPATREAVLGDVLRLVQGGMMTP